MKPEKLEFLPITQIPRHHIIKYYVKDKKESVLISLPKATTSLSFWVDTRQVFTNNYTLDFTLSLIKTFTYKVKYNGEDKTLTGDELYRVIINRKEI